MEMHDWWFLAAAVAGLVSGVCMLLDHPLTSKVGHALIGPAVACLTLALWVLLT